MSWSAEEQRVYEHVRTQAVRTFRDPQGQLVYPYLVPAGPYNQLWDWDSVFTGIGLLEFGGAPYLAGSMKNFFNKTDLETGMVRGCLTPDTDTGTIYHAKPVLIQGAWIAAKYTKDPNQFFEFRESMKALLRYWKENRYDTETGLYVWYDQMESGADDLPISEVPSKHTDGWNEKDHGLSISSTDVMVFLIREFEAFYRFCSAWIDYPQLSEQDKLTLENDKKDAKQSANKAKRALIETLWDEQEGVFIAYNTKTKKYVNNRVFLMALPLLLISDESEDECSFFLRDKVAKIMSPLNGILAEDMLTEFGIRSTSLSDHRYSNANIIDPYSNWCGPVWVIANVLLIYGISNTGNWPLSLQIARCLVTTLGIDLGVTGSWHECYHAETGKGLAAEGFLSWNTLAATLLENLRSKRNCLKL